jgi:inorganic pyrophosphatase
MFDSIIYRMLDKIVEWCERYKNYKINKSLPKGMSVKKWTELQKKSYK